MTAALVSYRLAGTNAEIIAHLRQKKSLYSYFLAGNGVFVGAANDDFAAVIPVGAPRSPIRGLPKIEPAVQINRRVPVALLEKMVDLARRACPSEILFSLQPCRENGIPFWMLRVPAQVNSHLSATPIEDEGYVPIEVHSHNNMAAFFSDTDNRDETGLRIYGVLGRIDQPLVDFRLRVSIYGHYASIPYEFVFEPSREVTNARNQD